MPVNGSSPSLSTLTAMEASFVTLPNTTVTLIVAIPEDTAVIFPFSSTFAILSSELSKVTSAFERSASVVSVYLPESSIFAVSSGLRIDFQTDAETESRTRGVASRVSAEGFIRYPVEAACFVPLCLKVMT